MRFLGVGDCNDLASMYLRLQSEGHQVKVCVRSSRHANKLRGLIECTLDWRQELAWAKDAGAEGIILFETTADGETQEQLRRAGYNVIGGSVLGDRLENDRAFGQASLHRIGLKTAPIKRFRSIAAGEAFLEEHPGRYVLKFDGPHTDSQESYVGELDDGRDLRLAIRRLAACGGAEANFVLMKHLAGVEVGVGAYFNGERFMDPVCIDWEHKRFFDNDIGEMTGEMGTLVSYRNAGPLFDRTLAKMAEDLRLGGHVGYVNLNTIVNEDGIWPLEFTCRFGYPGYAILEALHQESWAALFGRMIGRSRTDFATDAGFAVGAVLTVPPFPHPTGAEAAGWPLLYRRPPSAEDLRNVHLDEVLLRDGEFVTAGPTGYVLVATGTGPSVEEARRRAYDRMKLLFVPNGRYRSDIGLRFLRHDKKVMQRLGLWPSDGPTA